MNEKALTISSEVCRTDITFSEENNTEEICPTFDMKSPKSNLSSNANNTGKKYVQLDFSKLNEINFHAVASTLCKFGPSDWSLSAFNVLCTNSNEEKPEYSNEAELMVKLSDLSKDQLSACCSTTQESFQKKQILDYQRETKSRDLPYHYWEHPHGDSVSTKIIHSWAQLKSDETSEQPRTVFLDLRPEMSVEDQMVWSTIPI